jgi:hypothetical protein
MEETKILPLSGIKPGTHSPYPADIPTELLRLLICLLFWPYICLQVVEKWSRKCKLQMLSRCCSQRPPGCQHGLLHVDNGDSGCIVVQLELCYQMLLNSQSVFQSVPEEL